jgi:hypothetical protein
MQLLSWSRSRAPGGVGAGGAEGGVPGADGGVTGTEGGVTGTDGGVTGGGGGRGGGGEGGRWQTFRAVWRLFGHEPGQHKVTVGTVPGKACVTTPGKVQATDAEGQIWGGTKSGHET